ncbi:unnamed protein product [Chrysoparadoxa australica]
MRSIAVALLACLFYQCWLVEGLNPKTFVAGATGRTGQRVVNELVAVGAEVVAGVRDEQKAAGMLGSASVKAVDWTNKEAIKSAMEGCDAVVCTLGASESEALDFRGPARVDGQMTQDLIAAAKELGTIKHFTLVTSLGTAKFGMPASILNLFWGILTFKRKSELALVDSGLPYTIVRPGGMEKPEDDYDMAYDVVLRPADSTFGGLVSRKQVAKVVAAAVTNTELSANKVIEVITEEVASPKVLLHPSM